MTKAEEAWLKAQELTLFPSQAAMIAMKQHAMEFLEEAAGDGWIISDTHKWVNVMDHRIPEGKEYTTEQLYEQFNNEQP